MMRWWLLLRQPVLSLYIFIAYLLAADARDFVHKHAAGLVRGGGLAVVLLAHHPLAQRLAREPVVCVRERSLKLRVISSPLLLVH